MAIMQKGKVIEEGSVYDIFANPQTELAKEFINSVVSFDLPPVILEKCKGMIVKVTFKGTVAGEGVISDTLQQFNVKGNFLHGSIEYIGEAPLGIFIMELNGQKEEIEKALQFIENRTAQVEVLRNGL